MGWRLEVVTWQDKSVEDYYFLLSIHTRQVEMAKARANPQRINFLFFICIQLRDSGKMEPVEGYSHISHVTRVAHHRKGSMRLKHVIFRSITRCRNSIRAQFTRLLVFLIEH